MNKFKKKYILLLITIISIGFAALATQLSIFGTTKITQQSWDVHWENVQVLPGSVDVNMPEIDESGTTVTYTVNLVKPGDYLEFTVDAKNDGTIDAMIKNLSSLIYSSNDTETPIDLPEYIEYNITYSDGVKIKNNQLLKTKSKETYKVKVKYSEENLAPSNITLKFELKLDYVVGDLSAEEVRDPVCKRATTLHTEECTRESDGCYADGYSTSGSKGTTTITYGNLGTQGELNTGDAFDCDIDGDGEYEEDERFYYVSPRDADEQSEYATLIYYRNITKESYNDNIINTFPEPIAFKLPSTSEWSNIRLNTNMTRQIKNEFGESTTGRGTRAIIKYTFSNKAARLLTTQEVNSACNLSVETYSEKDLDNCTYLLENTEYTNNDSNSAWWLENPRSSDLTRAWYIDGKTKKVDYYYVGWQYGVRPAIEVKYSDISY